MKSCPTADIRTQHLYNYIQCHPQSQYTVKRYRTLLINMYTYINYQNV